MKAKEYFVPSNWRNFVQGNITYLQWKSKRDTLPEHILEQFLFRAYLCRDCLKNGRCLVCRCATPGMFFASGKKDSKQRWPAYEAHAGRWNDYKVTNKDWNELQNYLRDAGLSLRSDDIFNFLSSIPIQEEVPGSADTEQGNNNPIRLAA